MAVEQRREERRRKRAVSDEDASRADGPGAEGGRSRPPQDGDPPRSRRGDDRGVPAATAARSAAEHICALTGRAPESVISAEPCDGGWRIGVETVETRRIPDSADILAIYEVQLDAAGELTSYRRTRRYARGQTDRCRG